MRLRAGLNRIASADNGRIIIAVLDLQAENRIDIFQKNRT
jgi:hypothetical protein